MARIKLVWEIDTEPPVAEAPDPADEGADIEAADHAAEQAARLFARL